MSGTVNAEQAQRWNGDSGRQWIKHRERHVAVRQRLTPRLFQAARIAPGDRVLDVGCGCGESTIAAARTAGPGGYALGLDLSGPMLDVARRLAAEAGIAPDQGPLRFVQGDAQVHPLPPASFDVLISSFGVTFFDDPAAAFDNLVAALRPGGRLAFLSWQDGLRNEVFAIPLRAFATVGGLPDATGDTDPFADPTRVSALLSGAGCADIRIEPLREPARLGSDVADVLGYVRGMSRIRMLTGRLDPARAGRVMAAIEAQYASRARPDGVWVRAAAWLVTAVRRGSPPR